MFTLAIRTDNAAFELDPPGTVARHLERIAYALKAWGEVEGKVLDLNGNTCGAWALTQEEE